MRSVQRRWENGFHRGWAQLRVREFDDDGGRSFIACDRYRSQPMPLFDRPLSDNGSSRVRSLPRLRFGCATTFARVLRLGR